MFFSRPSVGLAGPSVSLLIFLASLPARGQLPAPEGARPGFQMAIRTGYCIPFGNIVENIGIADVFSGQVPLLADLGWKSTPNLFLGGYLGLGIGGVGGRTKTACEAIRASCGGLSARVGGEIQYHFLPDRLTHPWIGYGLGFEALSQSISAQDAEKTDTFYAFEFAHLMGGIDLRASRLVGIGPFIDFTLGASFSESITINGVSHHGPLPSPAGHRWLTLGVRGVLFP